MKKLLVFALVGVMLGLCLVACSKKSKPEHPVSKGAVSESEHPKAEHPKSEHPE